MLNIPSDNTKKVCIFNKWYKIEITKLYSMREYMYHTQ